MIVIMLFKFSHLVINATQAGNLPAFNQLKFPWAPGSMMVIMLFKFSHLVIMMPLRLAIYQRLINLNSPGPRA